MGQAPHTGPAVPDYPEIIAHRGYSGRAPENTLAAIGLALAHGAAAVEWDVQMARCGTPVVFHDLTLDRTTNLQGPLLARDADELSQADAGAWFHADFTGEPVPTLAQAVARASKPGVHLYPEIKAVRDPADAERIYEVVRDHGRIGNVTFISMIWEALDRIAALDPNVSLGYIVETPRRYGAALRHVAGDPRRLLDPDWRIVVANPRETRAALEQGTRLAVWTVNDPGTAEHLWRLGVTSFTSNEVERLLTWARGHRAGRPGD